MPPASGASLRLYSAQRTAPSVAASGRRLPACAPAAGHPRSLAGCTASPPCPSAETASCPAPSPANMKTRLQLEADAVDQRLWRPWQRGVVPAGSAGRPAGTRQPQPPARAAARERTAHGSAAREVATAWTGAAPPATAALGKCASPSRLLPVVVASGKSEWQASNDKFEFLHSRCSYFASEPAEPRAAGVPRSSFTRAALRQRYKGSAL